MVAALKGSREQAVHVLGYGVPTGRVNLGAFVYYLSRMIDVTWVIVGMVMNRK